MPFVICSLLPANLLLQLFRQLLESGVIPLGSCQDLLCNMRPVLRQAAG